MPVVGQNLQIAAFLMPVVGQNLQIAAFLNVSSFFLNISSF
jgi:hypothetical protein